MPRIYDTRVPVFILTYKNRKKEQFNVPPYHWDLIIIVIFLQRNSFMKKFLVK